MNTKKEEYGKSSTFCESHKTCQDHIWPYFNLKLTENNYYNFALIFLNDNLNYDN